MAGHASSHLPYRLVMPMDVISYVLGLFTEMSWTGYGLATALGLTPSAFILTYIGRKPRAYDSIMLGIGAALVGWIVYSTRRSASPRRRARITAMYLGTMLWSGTVLAKPVSILSV